jgi:hypothetical protein
MTSLEFELEDDGDDISVEEGRQILRFDQFARVVVRRRGSFRLDNCSPLRHETRRICYYVTADHNSLQSLVNRLEIDRF